MRQFSTFLALTLILTSCGTTKGVKRYSESKSHFNNPVELMKNNYPEKDIYRIYQRASTGFISINTTRIAAERRMDDFAKRQGKLVVVLGEKTSSPPYIMGNFPRIEIVFALVDKSEKNAFDTPKLDKFSKLEKLKKLFDDGALTKEEYEKEKKKILDEN